MKFKQAFQMIYDIHDQCGDRHGWINLKERLSSDVEKFNSFKEWENKLNKRTDISEDETWELECFSGSVRVLFHLMCPT